MVILHFELDIYTEGWQYQENLLPKYHNLLGHEVWLVASTNSFDENGKLVNVSECEYINKDGVRVIRIEKPQSIIRRKFGDYDVKSLLERIKPDYIFVHGVEYKFVDQIWKYKKRNSEIKFVMDNHRDYYNSSEISILGKIAMGYTKYLVRRNYKHVDKVFGVTDGRCKYLQEKYRLSDEKIEPLYMGVDTELIQGIDSEKVKLELAEKYGISLKKKIVISGGKLDSKKKIIELMDTFLRIHNNSKWQLVIFGSVDEDIRDIFFDKVKAENIFYIGFLDAKETNKLMVSADLGVFLGGHSVLWEQAVGSALPCIFRMREGFEYLNIGGNIKMWNGEDEISDILDEVLNCEKTYLSMKENAMKCERNKFSYYEIAKKSLLV